MTEIRFWEAKYINLESLFEQMKSKTTEKMASILYQTDSAYYPCFKSVSGPNWLYKHRTVQVHVQKCCWSQERSARHHNAFKATQEAFWGKIWPNITLDYFHLFRDLKIPSFQKCVHSLTRYSIACAWSTPPAATTALLQGSLFFSQ